MLLRSLTKHVKDQNWFAVFLDFFIVVAGILIAFQITNWNEASEDRLEYDLALDRYRTEIDANLKILDILDTEVAGVLTEVDLGFNALLSCEDTPKNRALVEVGIGRVMGSFGLAMRDSALRELTETQTLLAQQSPSERQMFSDTRYRMNVFLREARFIETLPLSERAQNNPIVGIGAPEKRELNYSGVDFSRNIRKPILNVPLDVACKDNMLVKSFYTWERWQSAMPAVTRILRTELEATKVQLEP